MQTRSCRAPMGFLYSLVKHHCRKFVAEDIGIYLYRIQSFKHVLNLLDTKELHFSSPKSWEDPFEKYVQHEGSKALFAQCWCKRAVSDAMWRIYSPDRMSIRIRTSKSKLVAALKAAKDSHNIGYAVGNVSYSGGLEVRQELEEIADSLDLEFDVETAAKALFKKRDAFDHEAEVRAVVFDKSLSRNSKPKPYYRIPIDPESFVENLYFDPRVDDAFYEMCKFYLKKRYKIKAKIGKSGLYRSWNSTDGD